MMGSRSQSIMSLEIEVSLNSLGSLAPINNGSEEFAESVRLSLSVIICWLFAGFRICIHLMRIRIQGFENERGSGYGSGSKVLFLREKKQKKNLYVLFPKHFSKHEKNESLLEKVSVLYFKK